MRKHLYRELARLVTARLNCIDSGNVGWKLKHQERIESLVRRYMPSGSGFDTGTHLDLGASDGERLVFFTSFHHMNEAGYYDGWTDHAVRVYPDLADGYRLVIGGRDRNGIKEWIVEVFDAALRQEVEILTEGQYEIR
jgi:hypothetical protein